MTKTIIERVHLFLVCLYTMFIPLSYYHGVGLRNSQEAFFQYGAVMLIASGMLAQKRITFFKENVWLLAFLAWCLFILVQCKFQVGIGVFMNMFLGIACYFVLSNSLRKEDTKTIFKCILAVCVINIAYIACQLLKFDPIYLITTPNGPIVGFDTIGTFGLKAAMGMYMAIAVSIFAYFNVWYMTLLIYPLWLSVSTSAVLAGGFSGLHWLWHKARIAFWVVLIVGIFGFSAYLKYKDNPMGHQNTRLTMWTDTLKVSLKRPLMGWGIDSFRTVYPGKKFLFMRIGKTSVDYGKRENYVVSQDMVKSGGVPQGHKDLWDNAHNSMLQLLFETGLIGLLFICKFMWDLMRRYMSSRKTKELLAVSGALLAFFVCSWTQFPDRLARISYLLPILLALFMMHTGRQDETNASY